MTFAFGEPVVIHSRVPSGQDDDGNDVFTSVDRTVEGVAVYPRESVELVQGQTLNIIGLTLVFDPPEPIIPTDQVTVRGGLYDVDGDPGQYASPLTGSTLTKVNLTRATG